MKRNHWLIIIVCAIVLAFGLKWLGCFKHMEHAAPATTGQQ